MFHLVLLIVAAGVLHSGIGPVLDLGQKRRVLGLDQSCHVSEPLLSRALVVLGHLELVGYKVLHLVFIGLLEPAAVELYCLVLNALLEGEIGMALQAHHEDVLIAYTKV